MDGRRSNEVGSYYVVFRVKGTLRRDVKVEATWETAEKVARNLVLDEYRSNGTPIDGGQVEFLGMY